MKLCTSCKTKKVNAAFHMKAGERVTVTITVEVG
jgi:hypothetical protein